MAQNKTIKFFISSTFKDFEQERDILHKFVFPELKTLCHKSGFGFQPIDLRWGVMEEAGTDQQTMNICLNEIKRSSYDPKPNLLLLVGQRYGWVPLPYDIEESEYLAITKRMSVEDKNLISDWYKPDENANPRTYFLQEKSKYKNDRDAWTEIEDQIKLAFQNATDLPRYHTSATEQEMAEGLDAFSKDVDHKHTFAYFRTIKDYEHADKKIIADFIDKNLSKVTELSNRLQKKTNIPEENQIVLDTVKWDDVSKAMETKYIALSLENCPAYLKKFHDDILDKFTQSIQTEINRIKENPITDLQIELEEQKKFLKSKSELVIGRKEEVDRILDFIKDEEVEEQYYLQYGKSGSGKTSVMAQAIQEIDKSKYEVIYRFIGTTALSTYSRIVFESIYWEIEVNLQNNKNIKKPIFEYDEQKFKEEFHQQLKKIEDKQVVIFLDALDQFEDYNDLTILLEGLPHNIKIVFSTLYDKEKDIDDYYKYYNRVQYLENKYLLEPLKQADNRTILEAWLGLKGRTLTGVQYIDIEKLTLGKTPLYLKLVFEMVKHFKVDDEVSTLAKNEAELIVQFLNFIQKQYHHEESLVKKTLGLISASKDGLSEEELIDLFSRDKEFLQQFQNKRYQQLDRLPTAIWSRFYYYIVEFFTEKLIDGEMLITPFHRIISETIKKEYYETKAEKLHKELADYFLILQDTEKAWDERYNNLHMLSETPYQLFKSKDSKGLKEILFDLEFAGSVYDNHKQDSFREILGKATELNDITQDEIYPWESFYRGKEHLITKIDDIFWRPNQSLFQLAYEDGENSPLTLRAEKLLKEKKIDFVWMKKRNRSEGYHRTGLLKVLKGHKSLINGIEILDDGRVLSWSEGGDLKLWSGTGEELTTLTGHSDSVNGAIILTDGRILSWSDDHTLRLWSNEGEALYPVLEGHTSGVSGAQVLKDGRILSWSGDNTLRLWSSEGEELSLMEGHTGFAESVQVMKDGRILSWSRDTPRLWNSEGEELSLLEGYIEGKGVQVMEDGRILSWSGDTLRLCNSEGELLALLEGHTEWVAGVKILNDGRILSYAWDNTLRLWSSKGEALYPVLEGHDGSIVGAQILNDGRILSYAWDNTLRLWSSEGEELAILEGHSREIIGAQVFTDDRILSYSSDHTLRLWSSEGEELAILEGHNGAISGAKILSDGRILSWSNDHTLRLWNTEGKKLSMVEAHNDFIDNIKLFDDGRILSRSWDKTLRLWNHKGEMLAILKGHEGSINAKILNDGRILSYSDNKMCYYSEDYTLKLWSSEGKELATLDEHEGFVKGVEILHDGRILSYAWDNTLRLWSSEGEELAILEGHNGAISGVEILSDGRILSWSNDHTLRLYFKTLE